MPSNSSTSSLPFGSTISLPLTQDQTAQSARSYLQSEGLANGGKQKLKTKGEASNLDAIPEKKKRGISSWFKKDTSAEEDEDEDDSESTGNKRSFFRNLGKKTVDYMGQLIGGTDTKKGGIAPLKWDNFVKVSSKRLHDESSMSSLTVPQVMREMGFTYDPSTAGSSVRFDPPDSRDPVSLHGALIFVGHLLTTYVTPVLCSQSLSTNVRVLCYLSLFSTTDLDHGLAHPDPTLYPNHLREFGKRLKRAYGWNEDDFLESVNAAA